MAIYVVQDANLIYSGLDFDTGHLIASTATEILC